MARALAAAILASLLGCGALVPLLQDMQDKEEVPPKPEPLPVAEYPGYAVARLNDFLDALPLSVAIGPGVLASVHVPFLGTGLGLTSETHRLGWPASPRQAVRAGTWREFMEMGIVIGAARASDVYSYDLIWVPIGPGRGEHSGGGFEWPQLLDVEATVHVGYLGARAGVSPIQLVDFLLGWFGLDIAEDDVPRRP